jgi:hypothetical protein
MEIRRDHMMLETEPPRGGGQARPSGWRCAGGVLVVLLLASGAARAADTDPTLALMRASAVRGAGGRATLTLEGSFSFANAVQLGLPLQIVVTQGARSVRYDLDGGVSQSVGGGPSQTVPPPGLIGMSDRTITLVLPVEFGAGDATVQVVGAYSDKPIASNRLGITL